MESDIMFDVGQVIGLLIGLSLFVWICHKIDNRIRGKDNKNEKTKDNTGTGISRTG